MHNAWKENILLSSRAFLPLRLMRRGTKLNKLLQIELGIYIHTYTWACNRICAESAGWKSSDRTRVCLSAYKMHASVASCIKRGGRMNKIACRATATKLQAHDTHANKLLTCCVSLLSTPSQTASAFYTAAKKNFLEKSALHLLCIHHSSDKHVKDHKMRQRKCKFGCFIFLWQSKLIHEAIFYKLIWYLTLIFF